MDQSSDSSAKRVPAIHRGIRGSGQVWPNHPTPLQPSYPPSASSSGNPIRTIFDLYRLRDGSVKWRREDTNQHGLSHQEPDSEPVAEFKRRFIEVFGSKSDGTIYTCDKRLEKMDQQNSKRQKLGNVRDTKETGLRRGDRPQRYYHRQQNHVIAESPLVHLRMNFKFTFRSAPSTTDQSPYDATTQDPSRGPKQNTAIEDSPGEGVATNETRHDGTHDDNGTASQENIDELGDEADCPSGVGIEPELVPHHPALVYRFKAGKGH
ncbi:hypothetical protein QBC40DRAFT_251342 [Triangularia verruculosa]|uniref:Uncharacterized protein n=1 Tax=Triangularia verruculosa TaxID=2587418 RepID=A0AAN7AXD6_9PEZI|nr:hypothetical protein QBC40DRAFT_251342 [Triangularia verruculosa]